MKVQERDHANVNKLSTGVVQVAIIGMASIFPESNNLEQYWENIIQKMDCIREVPPSRWNVDDYYDPDPAAPDKTYCKRGGFIPDVDFDPLEFGLPPNILEATDVSQLLSLVIAKEAMEDAGYGEGKQFNRDLVGVILGVVGVETKLYTPLMARLQYPVWEKVLKSYGVSDEDTNKIIERIKLAYVNWEENSFPGTIGNVIAGRIANRLDLGGTNCVVDAACASSLAAVRMAIGELVEGRADMMITGGVDTDNSIGAYMCFSKTPAFSKSQNARPFDADADGMMVGEGIGLFVLKRLADAERDHDRIYAVIKGVGSSSDGRFKSIYAPRPEGQAKALRRAYEDAGIAPSTIGLVEAHGTGTNAGDPAEVGSLKLVLGENNPNKQTIALGSVKSQIGHTKAAAGSASLMKIALALHHKVLPATINVDKPNPKLGIDDSPFYINTETRPWIRPAGGTPRRAGVSSFGFGGTNFHLVLEEYEDDHPGPYRIQPAPQAILLAAPDSKQLTELCSATLQKLLPVDGGIYFNELVQRSKNLRPEAGSARLGFLARNAKEAIDQLQKAVKELAAKPGEEAWELPQGIFYRKSSLNPSGKVVALFSGQGSQYPDMGRDLAVNFPTIRETFGAMDHLFVEDGLESLSNTVFPVPVFDPAQKDTQGKKLQRTEFAQPAIGTLSAGLYQILQAGGLKADFAAGHSFGELTALWAGGVLSQKDFFKLAKARGKAMAAPDDPNFDAGTMLAVKGDITKIQEELKAFPEITLANFNSNNQAVLAGSKPAIAQIKQALSEKGYSIVQLQVSAAFHTSLVAHAQIPFTEAIQAVTFNPPSIPVFSNTTGKRYSSDPESIRKTLTGHILKSVLWKDEIEAIYAEGGFYFIEFGPKNVLTNLVKNILAGKPHFAIALNGNPSGDSDRQLREAVLQLRVAGLALGDVDPFQRLPRPAPAKKKSPVTVKLNGGYYITEKTQQAFENALKEGGHLHLPATAVPAAALPTSAAMPPAPIPAQPGANPVQAAPAPDPWTAQVTSIDVDQVLGYLERGLAQIQAHQSETIHLHEQYLANQVEYSKTFSQIMQLGYAAFSNGVNTQTGERLATVLESLERSMARFHDLQQETLHVHEKYLNSQADFSNHLFDLVGQQQQLLSTGAAPLSSTPARPSVNSGQISSPVSKPPTLPAPVLEPIPAAHPVQKASSNGFKPAPSITPPPEISSTAAAPASSVDGETITKALFMIVGEKTGYPVEMLEPGMDMEADLGIDSIKRVEILGAMQSHFPDLPKIDPEALAELRTLAQIGEYLSKNAPAASSTDTAPRTPETSSSEVKAVAPTATSQSNQTNMTDSLLKIVSEKTGYPAEMLNLDMDMEADLGIDSIKRVEIMGAMQTRFPELPQVNADELAELRTLGQILDRLASNPPSPSSSSTPVVLSAAAASPSAGLPESAASTEPAPLNPSAAVDPADLAEALRKVVSEKTGYPAEMLDLGMDMEADLGIDSIKRVEIMGAIQAQFPNLPKVSTDALSELRTLQQILDYLSVSPAQPAEAAQAPANEAAASTDLLQRSPVRLKSLPDPDQFVFSMPKEYTCVVTDDGTQLTTSFVRALTERGFRVVVLGFPQTLIPTQAELPEGVLRLSLAQTSDDEIGHQLSAIQTDYGPVGTFIHLNPAIQEKQEKFALSDPEKEIIKSVFLAAKHLKEPLMQASHQVRSAFMSVVRLDGEFGLGEGTEFDPVTGGLFGLVKTLNLEWEPVFCRAIDLSPEFGPEESTQRILAEFYDPNRLITEVGYSPRGRTTLVVDTPQTNEVNA
ncbi:MAG: phosphopantetheine-binding protein [Chloroflexi bacterium]|nr:phosphopantetheine-binding protein [Chloroflexota bacterium]